MSTSPRIPESREVREDAYWRAHGSFVWRWPRFNIFHPADKRRRAGFNRYPHTIIGAYVIVFGRGWGVVWKGPK